MRKKDSIKEFYFVEGGRESTTLRHEGFLDKRNRMRNPLRRDAIEQEFVSDCVALDKKRQAGSNIRVASQKTENIDKPTPP